MINFATPLLSGVQRRSRSRSLPRCIMLALAGATVLLSTAFVFLAHALGVTRAPVFTEKNNATILSVDAPKVSIDYMTSVRFDLSVLASHHMASTLDPPVPPPCSGEKPGVCPDSPFTQSN
jgi:hypothetical protein